MDTHGPVQRRVWDEVVCRNAASLRDKVGEHGGDVKSALRQNTEVDVNRAVLDGQRYIRSTI